jgi:hypothetical protein
MEQLSGEMGLQGGQDFVINLQPQFFYNLRAPLLPPSHPSQPQMQISAARQFINSFYFSFSSLRPR